MSTQITTAFVKQYTDNVMLLVQQQGSRLRNAVRLETGKVGEEVFMERIGSTNAQEVTSRHADSPLIDTPHDRRRVVPKSYDWGDMVDNSDKLRMLIDPASPYAVNAAYAMGRAMDDLIISEALGTAYTGKSGSTSQTLPSAQKVAVAFNTYDSGSGDRGLTIGKLIEARRILGAGEADDYDMGGRPNLFIVANAKQMAKLLSDTSMGGTSGSGGISAASADYNSVRALVSGELDLVDVAFAVQQDDLAQVEAWTGSGQLGPVSDDLARGWFEREATLWAVVVRPWVLVQDMID